MTDHLLEQFDKIFEYCFNLFKEKQADYGPTWLLNRYSSLSDEIWRKARRIRTLEEQGDNAYIPEGRDAEYVGIINYCVMFLIRLGGFEGIPEAEEALEDLSIIDGLDSEIIFSAYRRVMEEIRDLLFRKNSDYGGAWKGMSIYSMTDQVIIRVYRMKTILNNDGQCKSSEGVASQLQDIINYCVFALIKMEAELVFKNYKYVDKPIDTELLFKKNNRQSDKPYVWQMVKEAVEQSKNKIVTHKEIREYILRKYLDVNTSTINCQILACCVNLPSRINWPENHKPRICKSYIDFLFYVGRGQVELYNPDIHGQWAICKTDNSDLAVKKIN